MVSRAPKENLKNQLICVRRGSQRLKEQTGSLLSTLCYRCVTWFSIRIPISESMSPTLLPDFGDPFLLPDCLIHLVGGGSLISIQHGIHSLRISIHNMPSFIWKKKNWRRSGKVGGRREGKNRGRSG